ncbi:MAG: hypothetical protein IJM44_00900 [Ruminococcus sp.]|nr:hypothetical protein [Ruminococcus sp.]
MKKLTKFAAALTAVSLAASSTGCTPTLGKGTQTALTIDGHDVRAGIFVYYTIQAYNEAVSTLSTSTAADLKKGNIDGLDTTDWIQNRATEYCRDYIAVEEEFEKLDIQFTDEDLANFDEIVDYYLAQDVYADNGVGKESISAILMNSLKLEKMFDYYYGPGGEKGMSDEELRSYYEENNARVKYIVMSYNDADGNPLTDAEKKEVRELADSYAEQINAVSGNMEKMYKMDELSEEYDEYVSTQTTTVSGETTTTTTTTTTASSDESSTETTTTDPYANEAIVQKYTTTTADTSSADAATTTTETSEGEVDYINYNDFVFNDLPLHKAVVYEYDDETVVVIIKEDIKERMTEDDLWSEDNVSSLVEDLYYQEYSDFLEEMAKSLSVEKNSRAYRKFDPFKLVISS